MNVFAIQNLEIALAEELHKFARAVQKWKCQHDHGYLGCTDRKRFLVAARKRLLPVLVKHLGVIRKENEAKIKLPD
jgi:hypothetical protein